MKDYQKLTKEELKSINAGSGNCIPWDLCKGQGVTLQSINACGWYIYKTAEGNICMEYENI